MDHENHEKLLGVKELTERTGLKPSWIYAQAEAKKIPYLKLGKYLRFRWSEIEAWLESHRSA